MVAAANRAKTPELFELLRIVMIDIGHVNREEDRMNLHALIHPQRQRTFSNKAIDQELNGFRHGFTNQRLFVTIEKANLVLFVSQPSTQDERLHVIADIVA